MILKDDYFYFRIFSPSHNIRSFLQASLSFFARPYDDTQLRAFRAAKARAIDDVVPWPACALGLHRGQYFHALRRNEFLSADRHALKKRIN